ncbi:hypothetical protein EDB92DRAFT_1337643 [Lactarius akahatsu]|uniref:BTB domain-containing protein n=1 Tax=Lactarius akahatsu TaxID=416441 RepID=A0AAD4Q5F7_9AGAM|nr:hypothetical protein EDB92DRAFT_1337643 [Lactarius akahatsu]
MQSDQKLDVVASKYHPLFSFESDVVLASRDGVLFRVPSTTLKMTSSWFRAMFTLPQTATPSATPSTSASPLARTSSLNSSADSEVISLDEDARTLEPLLRMACGLEIATLDTWDAVEPVLYAAEKYDMPGPASIVRALLRTPAFADAPLRLYAAACHFGWADDARAASTRSLVLDLHAPDHRAALMRLRTADLLALFELHHTRRAQFRARLAEPPFLTDVQLGDASAARCSRCREPISYAEWRELKHAMLYELERRPAGDTVLTGLEEWPLAQACWASRCKKTMCVSPVYDKALSSKAIKEVLDSLPNAVEMPVRDTA